MWGLLSGETWDVLVVAWGVVQLPGLGCSLLLSASIWAWKPEIDGLEVRHFWELIELLAEPYFTLEVGLVRTFWMRHEAELCKSYLEHGLLDWFSQSLSCTWKMSPNISAWLQKHTKIESYWVIQNAPCFWKIYQHLSKNLHYTRHEAYGYGANCFTSRSNSVLGSKISKEDEDFKKLLRCGLRGVNTGEHQKYWKLSGTVKKDGKVANIMRSCWFHHIVGEIHQVF